MLTLSFILVLITDAAIATFRTLVVSISTSDRMLYSHVYSACYLLRLRFDQLQWRFEIVIFDPGFGDVYIGSPEKSS